MSHPIATIPAPLAEKNPRIAEVFRSKPHRFVLRWCERTGNMLVFDAETYVPSEEPQKEASEPAHSLHECVGTTARKAYRDPSPEASPITRRFADYRDPRHREHAAATICERGKAAGAVEYFCSVKITEQHWQIGRAIGEARTGIAILNGRLASRAREWDNESEAAVAELVVSQLLGGGSVQRAPLVLAEADDGVDLNFADGTCADIKCVSADHDAVFINNSAHLDKSPDFYVVAHIFPEIIDLFLINAAAIDGWKVCKYRGGKPLPPTEWYRMGPLFVPAKPAAQPPIKRDTATEIEDALAILAG